MMGKYGPFDEDKKKKKSDGCGCGCGGKKKDWDGYQQPFEMEELELEPMFKHD